MTSESAGCWKKAGTWLLQWWWLVAGVLLSATVGLVLNPSNDWAKYYFSSFFQGFAALLGIALTGVFISFQLAADQWGSLIAWKRGVGNPFMRRTLLAFTLILALAGLGLGAGSLVSARGLLSVIAACLLRVLGGLVLLISFVAGKLSWDLLGSLASSLTPSRVLFDLATDLTTPRQILDNRQKEIRQQNVIDALGSLWSREALFRNGWDAYLGVIRSTFTETSPRHRLTSASSLSEPLGRLFAARGSTLLMATTLVSLTHEAVGSVSPAAFHLARAAERLDEDDIRSAFEREFGPRLELLAVKGSSREELEELGQKVAADLMLWDSAGMFAKVMGSLNGRYRPQTQDLIAWLRQHDTFPRVWRSRFRLSDEQAESVEKKIAGMKEAVEAENVRPLAGPAIPARVNRKRSQGYSPGLGSRPSLGD